MNAIFKTIKSLKWFFVSTIIVILIAMVLSHVSNKAVSHDTLYYSIMRHDYFWLLVRTCIVGSFIITWPYLIRHWAQKYKLEEEYVQGLIRRRWRYAFWLIIIDLVFQLF